MPGIEIAPAQRRRDVAAFHRLPFDLHRDHAGWLPPLLTEEERMFDAKRNPAYRYCDAQLWLARQGGAVVGRIAGIVNRRYNEQAGERTARFSHLEATDDAGVTGALLDAAAGWARGQGLTRMIGPFGFTDQDPEGFIIEGQQEETSVASYYNFPYIITHLETLGWAKFVDYVVYRIPVPDSTPELYARIMERVKRKGGLATLEFTKRSQMKPFVRPVLQLMNDTFVDITGYAPLDDHEMDDLAKRWLPMLDPRFVKLVTNEHRLVAFVIGIPCMNEGLRKSGGRLLPLGWWHIIRSAKRAKRLDLLLGGILPEYRGRGVDALLGTAMMRSAREAGMTTMDSHNELEHNTKIQAEMARMGGQVYKRFRIFEKGL